MAPALAWDGAAIAREITHYRARLKAESAAQVLLDDAASNSARAGVRDPRLDLTAAAS
jgi:glycerol-3-phosphate dehydrogenase